MKPTKNRIYCRECGRAKMLFETEKKALLFMQFNNEEIAKESEMVPQRAYYCKACAGWHLTHFRNELKGPSKTDLAIEHMRDVVKEHKRIKKEQKETLGKINQETSNYVVKQIEEADKAIVECDRERAVSILKSILDLSKIRYITPNTLKRVRKKLKTITN